MMAFLNRNDFRNELGQLPPSALQSLSVGVPCSHEITPCQYQIGSELDVIQGPEQKPDSTSGTELCNMIRVQFHKISAVEG